MNQPRVAEPGEMGSSGALDPITFEVIRHRLWAINDEQGRMAARLSGSFIVYEGHDFNAALVTADGRGLYCGVYILWHGATIDEFVRKVMAEWPADEIREGDMFFTNDPWWGALHANDGILAMPIFWEGEVVAWSGIVLHDDDVGSPVPGSFVSGSRDRFAEAPLLPGVKMVENFEPVRDIERVYLRNSRTPERNALNMRARVAALRATHRRIQEVIAQYGVDAFLAAQDGIIDYVERVLRRRLREIPDGGWFSQIYLDHDGNENRVYRMCCQVTKRDDRLMLDMAGTSPQAAGAINCARPALEGAALGVVLIALCYDLPWSIGALRRVVEIVSEPGTLNDALSPAGVSMASVMGCLSTQDVVIHGVAKMLMASERYRSEAQATWTPGIDFAMMVAPTTAGEPAVGAIVDAFSGGGGARSFADGIDSGGIIHSMGSQVANAETVEQRVPVLQVYRRELPDAGGPGRFRGGVAIEFASVVHKLPISPAGLNVVASGIAMPAGRGLSGGSPGAAAANVILRASDIADLFARGRVPLTGDEIAGEIEVPEAKSFAMLEAGDVVIGRMASGAGYGDPLRRDPSAVLSDLASGLVSPSFATSIYGVVLDGALVDAAATSALRDELRALRLESGRVLGDSDAELIEQGTLLHPVADTVEAVEHDGGERSLRCTVCRHRLCGYDEDHKRVALMRELPLSAAGPHNDLCLTEYVLREFSCPSCATAFAVDVQHRDEPILDESRTVASADRLGVSSGA
jgi:N-methylhydantoinase B